MSLVRKWTFTSGVYTLVWFDQFRSIQAKDKELLEQTQKRCLKLLLCPNEIELETLQKRRERTDLTETFKFKKGCYKTNPERMFTSSHTGQLRGHSEKTCVTRPRLDIRKHFFSQRAIKP